MKKVGKIVKIVFLVLLFTFNMALILRVCMLTDDNVLNHLITNETTISAYKSNPESFEAFTQSVADPLSDNGYISISNVIYIPAAKQFQVTVRYNNSVLKDAIAIYGEPDKNTEAFSFDLSLVKDDGSIENIAHSYSTSETKYMYNYRRLIYDGVSLDGITRGNINMRYSKNSTEKFSTIIAYYNEGELIPYKLSKKELDLLD